MKITKIILKNFSAVKNAMDTNSIEIDFSSAINKICLIIGKNGSGKTTILSMLHPFADLGNLDIRNGNGLVLDGKEGYKEIHIKRKNDIYVIKHYYTPHKGKNHSVKSYISKNDVELNINGNVSSFKEYVRMELQIEPDYLKLIRLGSNVTSLIDLSATERKNFMSKIMDDIGVFLEYFKSVNNKIKQLSEMISHSVDKLNRLGIVDKKEFKREIEELRILKESEERKYIEENKKLPLLNSIIDNIEDSINLKSNLNKVERKYNKMRDILDNKNKYESFEVEYYNKKIKKLESSIDSSNNEYNSNIALIQNSLQHLNTLQEQLRSYEIQLKKEVESDKEIVRMNENLNQTRLRLREYENIIEDFKPNFTKKELEDFIIFLKNTQNILRRTYEFGRPPIERVVELMRNNKNVINYINRHLIDLDEKKGDTTSLFISTIASRFMTGKEDIVINCKEECYAKTLFNQIKTLIENSNVDDKNEDASFYHDMEFVHSNLISILPKFSDYSSIINSLPEDMKVEFSLKNIYDKISSLGSIYDEKKMNKLLSLTTEYDNYISLLEVYGKDEEMISRIANMSNSKYLREQVSIVSKNIQDTNDKIMNLKERNMIIQDEIIEDNRSLEVYGEIKETIEKFDEIKSLYERYSKEYETFTETQEKIITTELSVSKLKISIDNITTELQRKISMLDQYSELSKDLEKMNKIYDEMLLTKEALSAKQGMPLHFISNYLNNTEEITNELLDIAYDGDIFIDRFNITPTEFSIPFYNKGVRLSDVKYASQGELSFLSIALSFALSSQALQKYNIMLLDEVDGPLDTNNREKFIRILENQIDRIESEQNFLITHNSMFSSYPVDILDLSFKNDSDAYPLASFIKIKK